jgi:CBS-domain-containing membrane protein
MQMLNLVVFVLSSTDTEQHLVLNQYVCRAMQCTLITHSDIVRAVGLLLQHNPLDTKLEEVVSRPLLTIMCGTTVEEEARFVVENQIHNLPIVRGDGDKLVGKVTITDLAVFLSPSIRPGLVSLI